MPEVFFISDTHFGHRKILEFEPICRPFKSIEEHDEKLIKNWNKIITKRDVIYHLGDILFGNDEYARNLLAQLKGLKKLILGNHDNYNQIKDFFHTIYGVHKFDGNILSHIPIHPSQFYRFKYNLHGHMHSKSLDDYRYINLSCEQTDLAPIPYDIIKKELMNEYI